MSAALAIALPPSSRACPGGYGCKRAAGSIGGIDLAATADPSAPDVALDSGATRFDALQLSATLDNGTATLSQGALAGPDGSAQISGTVDLPGSALDVLARLSQGAFLRLSGPMGAPRWSTAKPAGLK